MSGRIGESLLLAAVLLVVDPTGADAAQESEDPPPAQSSLEERVKVQLVEIKILVTDRQGRPVTDLRPEEVRVLQKGVEQKLAYLERLSQRTHDVPGIETPPPSPVYTADGAKVESDVAAVLPPRPVRRVIFAFDVRNSKIRVRDDWREAALAWVRDSMQPEDQAGVVVFTTYPEWILKLTDDKDVVVSTLSTLRLEGVAPHRDRRDELTRLLDELQALCTDSGRVREGGPRMRSQAVGAISGDEDECSYQLVRPVIFQWNAESGESIDVLRTLSGELAAVPGQKTVILFSEGIIPDAGAAGLNAMLSVFGIGRIDFRDWAGRLSTDSYAELTALQRTASGADVVFFTFDTRSAAEGSTFSNLEQHERMSSNSLALDPWSEMYEATRTTLTALANATGGMSFYGTNGLADDVKAAAESFFGIYTVGYYSSNPSVAPGRVRIKINRKRTHLSYDKHPDFQVHRVRRLKLELNIGRPRATGQGDLQWLPVSLQTPMEALPLRSGAGGHGCQLGLFVQAVRPDGTIAAEAFETLTAFVEKERWKSRNLGLFRHDARLELPPGPYRLRVRLSDDRQEVVGDRSIDLTLTLGGVQAGLQALEVPSGTR